MQRKREPLDLSQYENNFELFLETTLSNIHILNDKL